MKNPTTIPGDICQEIALFMGTLASTGFAHKMLAGESVPLSVHEALYCSNLISKAIRDFLDFLDHEMKPDYNLKTARTHILPACAWIFDKTAALVYNLRTGNQREIRFSIQDLYSDKGWGDDCYPKQLEFKVAEAMLDNVEKAGKTIDYLMEKNYFDRYGLIGLTEQILYGCSKPGVEFGLRLALFDLSENIEDDSI
jgi:hypothetical protein